MEDKIYEILPESHILLDMTSRNKKDVLKEMVDLLEVSPHILDKNELLNNLMERERLQSTGIGDGIALPHARTDSVNQLIIGFGRSEHGIEYDSLDENLVHILFLIAAPKTASTHVLKVLAKIARLLNNVGFRKKLLATKTEKGIQDLFRSRE